MALKASELTAGQTFSAVGGRGPEANAARAVRRRVGRLQPVAHRRGVRDAGRRVPERVRPRHVDDGHDRSHGDRPRRRRTLDQLRRPVHVTGVSRRRPHDHGDGRGDPRRRRRAGRRACSSARPTRTTAKCSRGTRLHVSTRDVPSTGIPALASAGVLLLALAACSSGSESRSDDDNWPGSGDGETEADAPVDDGRAHLRHSAAGGPRVRDDLDARRHGERRRRPRHRLRRCGGRRGRDQRRRRRHRRARRRTETCAEGSSSGLADGEHTLEVTAGDETVSLDVTSHPKNGPVFSGPHLEPWVCTTEAAGLGPATDADCDAPSKTTYSYRSTDGATKPLADPAVLPADVATTSRSRGATCRSSSAPSRA